MTTEYNKQRRVVLRRLAEYLDESLVSGYEWVSEHEDSVEPLDEPTLRRRVKAVRAVMAELERKGREP